MHPPPYSAIDLFSMVGKPLITSLVGWYRAGLDVEALLPRLSTYLGHREPRFTYRYLTATPELLGHAAARLEAAREAIR